ncbi:hypothetical protein C8R44DRAFT_744074 [Mycena epipterygia]|nr:hypothetical protein C8R44DRAFT_744074 [Mycena epipterygia]
MSLTPAEFRQFILNSISDPITDGRRNSDDDFVTGRTAPFDLKVEQTVSDVIAAPHGYLVASTGHIAASSLPSSPSSPDCPYKPLHFMSSSGLAHKRDNISAITYSMAVQIWDITTTYIGTQKSKNLHIKVFKQGETIETIKEQDYNNSGGKLILNPP